MDNLTYLEKYQPTSLYDMKGHDTIRKILISMVEQNSVPHICMTGPPGVGKSTAATCMIKDLYKDDYKSNYMKISTSSDELGIDTIRGKVKDATRYKSLNYPFKIILIEEVDGLSSAGQFAFREIMLQNQQITRFIMVCNNLSKLIPPIQDRCQILRFAPLTMDNIANHLKLIVKSENINIKLTQISTIAALSNGSMRNAVNALQSCATQDHITDDLIRTLLGARFDSENANKILKAVLNNEQSKYEEIIFRLVYNEGFTPDEIMSGILDTLISKNNPKLIRQITLLAEYHFRMSQGANPLLQLRCGLERLSGMKR